MESSLSNFADVIKLAGGGRWLICLRTSLVFRGHAGTMGWRHRITESLGLEITSKIKSAFKLIPLYPLNHVTKCHFYLFFLIPPGILTSPVHWRACSNDSELFQWRNFSWFSTWTSLRVAWGSFPLLVSSCLGKDTKPHSTQAPFK